jgi:hypothetical protein
MTKTIISSNKITFYDENNNENVKMTSKVSSGKKVLEFRGQGNSQIKIKKKQLKKKKSVQVSDISIVSLNLNDSLDYTIDLDPSNTSLNFINGINGYNGTLIINSTFASVLTFKYSNQDVLWVGSESSKINIGTNIYNYRIIKNVMNIYNLKATNVVYENVIDEATSTVQVYNYNSSNIVQSCTLPSDVNTCTVYVWGAQGSNGKGGYTQSALTLPQCGMTLYIVIGKGYDGTYGGGASVVYYIYNGITYNLLISGGGGSNGNGGGLYSTNASQLSGTISQGLSTGLGQNDGSGAGYYSGSNGNGGTSYIGSHILLENDGIMYKNHGTLNTPEDTNYGRLDINSKVLYRNTVCVSLYQDYIDYYYNENESSIGSNGFVYISYNPGVATNVYGVTESSYDINTSSLSATLDPLNIGTHLLYFIYEGKKLVNVNKILNGNINYTPPFNGKYEFALYSSDINNTIYGSLGYTSFEHGIYSNSIDLTLNEKFVSINDYITQQNVDHYILTIHDNYLNNTFHYKISDLPYTFNIGHGSVFEVYLQANGSNGNKFEESKYYTLQTATEAINETPGVIKEVVVRNLNIYIRFNNTGVHKITTQDIRVSNLYAFPKTLVSDLNMYFIGSNDNTNWSQISEINFSSGGLSIRANESYDETTTPLLYRGLINGPQKYYLQFGNGGVDIYNSTIKDIRVKNYYTTLDLTNTSSIFNVYTLASTDGNNWDYIKSTLFNTTDTYSILNENIDSNTVYNYALVALGS